MDDRNTLDFTRIYAPDYGAFPSPDTGEAIRAFTLVDARVIRPGGKGTSRAWEMTFRTSGPLQDGRIAPGMKIGLFAANDAAKVGTVLNHLRKVSKQPIPHTLPPFGRMKGCEAKLTPEQILAHCCDLTHPSTALLDAARIPQGLRKKYAELPVEQFVQQPGVWLDFDTLVRCQPELKNRKYTPSRVDRARGEISILVSEAEKSISANGLPLKSRGPMTHLLVHGAERHLAGDRTPFTVQGFFDLREHKLPYSLHAGPKILIGTGVGLAPHLAYLRDCAAKGRDPNVALLLSGVRHPEDMIFTEELSTHLPRRKTGLFKSFDPVMHVYSNGHSGKREYVGDALLKHSDLVWQSLNHKRIGGLYICGWKTILPAIESSLKTIAEQHGENGDAWLAKLRANGQIHESLSTDDRFFRDFEQTYTAAKAQQTGYRR